MVPAMETPQAYRSPLRDRPLRTAGESLHDRLLDIAFGQIFGWAAAATIMVVFAGLEWLRYFHPTSPRPKTLTVIAVVVAAIAVIRVRRLMHSAAKLKMARHGELMVAEMLQQLVASGWRVFHDVPAQGFNVDHVAIGPRGILAIETKTRSKPRGENARIVVDDNGIAIAGRHIGWEPVEQAQRQATWLKTRLTESTARTFDVRTIVLYPGWFIEDRRKRKIPWVLGCKELPKWVEREARVLENDEVAMASDHLDRYIRTSASAVLGEG